jgi:hypothetical protein
MSAAGAAAAIRRHFTCHFATNRPGDSTKPAHWNRRGVGIDSLGIFWPGRRQRCVVSRSLVHSLSSKPFIHIYYSPFAMSAFEPRECIPPRSPIPLTPQPLRTPPPPNPLPAPTAHPPSPVDPDRPDLGAGPRFQPSHSRYCTRSSRTRSIRRPRRAVSGRIRTRNGSGGCGVCSGV